MIAGMEFLPLINFPSLNKDNFDCGDEDVNKYLREDSVNAEKADYSRVFVMTDKNKTEIIGYYTLSSSVVSIQDVPEEYREGFKIPSPAILIGQFGIDKKWRGMHYGRDFLLPDVYRRIYLFHNQSPMGFRMIKVDTQKESAKNFWIKQGFIPCKKNPNSLFIPIKTIIQLFP